MEDHLGMTWAALVSTKKELDSLKDLRQKFDASEEKNQRMKAEFYGLVREVQHLKSSDNELRKMMKDMKKRTAEDTAKLASLVQPQEKRKVSRLTNDEIPPSVVNSEHLKRKLEHCRRMMSN